MLTNQRLKAFISTTQSDKAKEFYIEKLGLKLLSEDSYGFELDSGGTHIRISFVEKLTPHQFTVLGWEIVDINLTIKYLKKKGVIFERYTAIVQDKDDIWTSPGGTRVAWLKDPDGNLLSLSDK